MCEPMQFEQLANDEEEERKEKEEERRLEAINEIRKMNGLCPKHPFTRHKIRLRYAFTIRRR